eukprot:11569628-Ditylum_brightwellii.AAC.2
MAQVLQEPGSGHYLSEHHQLSKILLKGNALVVFKNTEGLHGPQSKTAYAKAKVDVHAHDPPYEYRSCRCASGSGPYSNL